MGGRAETAPVPTTSWSYAIWSSTPDSSTTWSRRPATSILVANVLRRTCIPVALRSSSVRCARLRQWVTSPET